MNAPEAKPQARKPIGRILIERGLISEDQLRIALKEQVRSNLSLGKQLIALGFVTEATLRDALSENLGTKGIDLAHIIIDPTAIRAVPREFAKRHSMFPLEMKRETARFSVALADPSNVVALDQLRAMLMARTGIAYDIVALLASESEVIHAIDQYFGHELSIDGILHEIETGEIDYASIQANFDEYSQPVVRLIDAILNDAAKQSASDIHFEPEQGFLRVRYRLDGVLRQIRSLHKNYWPAMVVRLKVMSAMNIAETRAPQDGRFSLVLSGRPVDFRVSSLPTTHGENLVLRILDRQKGIVPLEQLGLDEPGLQTLQLMIARPEGMILVTGPTGSGKTTTLYSILNRINVESINIMTLEEPVEYPMPLIRQTSVNEAVKLDFANGIRSMMRQDPDVILVGEIRDQDTAEMAFRAAMTGHQVYSTLHTNSAIGAIPRLLDLGVLPDIMAGNIIGVIAQRLVRRLCTRCKNPTAADATTLQLLRHDKNAPAPMVYSAMGCSFCNDTGYKGRMAIMEILKMDADIDELVSRRGSGREMRKLAEDKGFRSLAEDGVRRVLSGETSLDEISRVVDLTDRIG